MKKYSDSIPHSPMYRRKRTPTIIQMEAVECGAACLAMILAYYGKYIPLEQLRVSCSVTRDGVSVFGILSAAGEYGFLSEAHQVDLEGLYDMPLPLIAYWEFNHFVVIEGFSRDEVYINDPAMGPVTITYEDLNKSFTGVVLLFEKGPHFVKSGSPLSATEIMGGLLAMAKIPFIYAFIIGLFLLFPGFALPALSQVFIDKILIEHIFSWQGWFLATMFIVGLMSITFKYLQQRLLSRLYIQMSTALSGQFLWHTLRLPYQFYIQRYSGEIANRLQLNDGITRILTTQLTSLFVDAIVAIFFGLAMFYYDSVIASFAILITLANVFLMQFLYRSREDAFHYYRQASGKEAATSVSAIKGIDTLKATGIEPLYFCRWAGYYTKGLNAQQVTGQKDLLAGTIPAGLKTLSHIMLLCFGAWRVIDGNLTIGMLVALDILMENFTGPITRLVNFNQLAQQFKVDTSRLNDVLKNPVDHNLLIAEESNDRLQKLHPEPKLRGFIEVKNLSFGYDKHADPILSNINFRITPGTSLGIVGSSGSGKSTLAKVLSGLIPPWSGEILFDNYTRQELPHSLLVNSLAVVEQDTTLFLGTIKDNISFFNPTVSFEEIVTAAQDANIHDLISSRKGGYEIKIQNNGSNFSGGERQRLELARVFAKKPSILILDEATSALDTQIEANVMTTIRRKGLTSILIAHRLSTTRLCDEIIVLDKGKIVERGTPDGLMEANGVYRSLVELEKNKKDEF